MGGKRRRPPAPPPNPESLTGEALTIAWLLSVFTTLTCEIGAVIAFAVGGGQLPVFGGLLLFSALVIGLASVGLGELVKRYRVVKAPHGVKVFALTVGLLPIGAALLLAFR